MLVALLGIVGNGIRDAGFSAIWVWIGETVTWFVGGLLNVPISVWVILGTITLVAAFLCFRYRSVGGRAVYGRLVHTTLRYRWTTVALACIVMGIGYHLYTKVGKRPFRWQPARRVTFNIEVPRSYSLEDGLALYEHVNEILLPRKKELNIDAISARYSTTGRKGITLYLAPIEEGTLSVDQVKKKVKALLPKNLPGVRFKSGRS